MKKRYWIIDDATSATGVYDADELPEGATEAEAIEATRRAWDRLTEKDQERRDAFYLVCAPEGDEGMPDLDAGSEILTLK